MYKGIVLAGGSGTRLYPATRAVSKQLLVVYDKPMIYYPIATLMLAGITEILVITTPQDQEAYRALLGDGSQWGLKFSYIAQPRPEGLAQAFTLGREFLDGAPAALTLGDNLFFGHGFTGLLREATSRQDLATVFLYQVSDPQRYGVAEFDAQGDICRVVEKPPSPPSRWAVTGLYFFGPEVTEVAAGVEKSARGELEITEVINHYIRAKRIRGIKMGRGYAWLDTGTHDSLLEAGQFIATLEKRQGLKVACPEEIAYRHRWIDAGQMEALIKPLSKNGYGQYLQQILREDVR